MISIIIPAFNAQPFLHAAITSALSQTPRPEIIVIDDGSTDATAEIAAAFGPPVTLHRQQNAGPAAARNAGIARAAGAHLGFLDADDIFEPGSLAAQLAILHSHPQADIAIGRLLREQREGAHYRELPTPPHLNLHFGACLFRRQVFARVGPLAEQLRQNEDWDWFMRARELGILMQFHDSIILRQRLHETNLTRDRAESRHHLALMLKRSLDRRRTAGPAANLPPLKPC